MAKKTSNSTKNAAQFAKTQANKIRSLEKELAKNPNNTSVREALEFWKTTGKKQKH